MLRILVISLFVANLLLFAFQRNNPVVEEETTVTPAVKKDSGIPTIHLFSEMMQDQGLLNGNRQCFSLGPFHSSEVKDEFRLLLQEVSTNISERQTEALVEKGYWVFMPPYDTLLEANQVLISLQALGLEDIAIIYDGEWKNAISLGYFMRQENALRRQENVEKKGYEPRIRVQRQGEPRYWLDYEQNPGSGLIALDMQNRPNDFMQRSLPCPEDDTVEFAGEDSQQPAQVMAELQTPGDDNEPAPDSNEGPDIGGDTENTARERGENLPAQAVETETEDITGGDSADATGTGADNEAVILQEDNNDLPDDAAITGQEADNDTVPEKAATTVQQADNETLPEDLPGDAADNGQEDDTGTVLEEAVGTGQEDDNETLPEEAPVNGQEGDNEIVLEEAVGTGQEDNNETLPEEAPVNGQEDDTGTASADAVEAIQGVTIDTQPGTTVGTGPLDVINTAPGSAADDGSEDTLETGQEPADETVQDDSGEAGTGEG